jgi:MGT family glycosyltransferase
VVDTDRLIAAYAGTRREIGLPPTAERPAWERELVLSSLPPSWTNAERLGGDIHHVRLPALDPTGAPAPPPWLAQLGRERPLIYATLGTVYNGLRGLRRSLFEAFAGVPADVLFTVGANVDVQRLGDVPPNVRVEQFVPQSIVLAHADLLVSHAGLGTVLGAIYDGVPMVLITIGADHPINSSRAAELGIANTIDIAHADGRSLRDVINDALADDGLRSAARSIQQECNAMSPIVSAVETLERYAGSMPG